LEELLLTVSYTEIRNQIYRLAFLSNDRINLQYSNLGHSGSLLSTCRQVYDEARSILYGENQFFVDRDKTSRRQIWQRVSKEVGYKHFHIWLANMSPSTRAMIRTLHIELDDAMPSQTPEMKNNEERRYVHDGHLIEAIKLLAQDGKLKQLTVSFLGRKALAKTDHRFLKYFSRLQADEVKKDHPDIRWGLSYHRIHSDIEVPLFRDMTRKTKLYPTDEAK
jgi:hypothetical protein